MRYLAIDIGASSGKIVGAELHNNKIVSEVTYRFQNGIISKDGHLIWDLNSLFNSIVEGLSKSGNADFISIDTWGVDFVLLDKNFEPTAETISYRDPRTDTIKTMPNQNSLYKRTGIQFQRFNTIYQLLSIKEQNPSALDRAEYLLFIPDYLNWLLTGNICQEYTDASTSNLLLAGTSQWDFDTIRNLCLPERLFSKLSLPGTIIGNIKPDIAHKIGYSPKIILAPSHDTASAVYGSLADEKTAFLSSGTWSLFGCLSDKAETGNDAEKMNFTNEGGRNGDIRFLRNIMGTWMLQNLRKDYENRFSFQEIEERARNSKLIGFVDPTDQRFLAPISMKKEIIKALAEQGIECPDDIGIIANTIYHSLAKEYGKTISGIEKILCRKFESVNIIGGGSKDMYLNELTGKYTGLDVLIGPSEGTAIGNILSSMTSTGEISQKDKNRLLMESFNIKKIARS